MTEVTRSPEVSLRLARAQEFIDRGKQRRALEELWDAEALARGDADAIRDLIQFTAGLEERLEPKQESRFAELVATLQHDAKTATGARAVMARAKPSIGLFGLICLSLAGAMFGVLFGGIIGSALYTRPPDTNALIDLSGLNYVIYGGLIGLFIGAIGLPLSVWLLSPN